MFFGFDLTQAIEVLGYPGIFAIVLAESGLFFGVSLPGGSMLFTAGLLASQGLMNIWILSGTVFVAAVLGDAIGYWFGAWVGPALWRRPDSRFFKKRYLEQTRDFFEKHGAHTILLARFIPVIRTFAPIVAGVTQMNYRTFFSYNILGAIIWGGGYTIAGYILGETVPGIEDYLEWIVLGILIVTSAPFLMQVYASRKKAQKPAAEPQAQAVIFDMDGTLTESFVPPAQSVLDDLVKLAHRIPIAIMSGASFDRIQRDVLQRMQGSDTTRLYVFSDGGAQSHMWQNGAWHEMYNYILAPQDRRIITDAIREAATECDLFAGEPDTSRILDRETSVAWTALKGDVTPHQKREWDKNGEKLPKLLAAMRKRLSDFEVLIGGKTTIDVTRKGITKAFGVEWLAKDLSLEPKNMLFIGDGFMEGGNDAIVIPTGIQTTETSGPEETLEIIADLLESTSYTTQ